MKVMRISYGKGINYTCPVIEIGYIVTVAKTLEYPEGTYYEFMEVPPKKIGNELHRFVYNAKNFAILPEPDADQMADEVKEAIVNIETAIV